MSGASGSKPLTSEKRRALRARVDYYRDMGIHDFYRRGRAVSAGGENAAAPAISAPEVRSTSGAQIALMEVGAAAVPLVRADDPVEALRLIREDLGECTRCVLHKGRKQIVFGVGNPRAELMFVGEGPGADEDEQGEPFVGRAGQLLTKMIEDGMGLRRADVYIANVVKCRPPGNRTPEREECDTCSPFLLRQIEAIAPRVIVCLGAVAAKTLLAVNESMGALRGRWHDFRGTRVAVTYHPAYLLRDPRQKGETWKDLQMVMEYLGIPVPRKSV
ncbi:MAG: uracil-DNA glycosylase [Terriglobales bacterium]